jgi:hypothetical protein
MFSFEDFVLVYHPTLTDGVTQMTIEQVEKLFDKDSDKWLIESFEGLVPLRGVKFKRLEKQTQMLNVEFGHCQFTYLHPRARFYSFDHETPITAQEAIDTTARIVRRRAAEEKGTVGWESDHCMRCGHYSLAPGAKLYSFVGPDTVFVNSCLMVNER